MSDPLVSFLVPAYNVAPYIAETLDSVLKSPRQDIEIVVVDDGSTDRTPDILAAIHDPRLRIVRQPNRGLPAARNTGIRNARGAYLIFLDGDDLYEVNALDRLLDALKDNPDAVMSYGNNIRFLTGMANQAPSPYGTVRSRPSGRVLREILQGNFISTPGVCCSRRSAVEMAGPFDETLAMAEDWEFLCRLAAVGTFVFVPVTCLYYRQHPASMSRRLGLDAANYRRFSDTAFAQPAVIAAFPPSELADLRRSHDAHIRAYIATLALERGEFGKAWAELVAAIRLYPARAPEFVLRLLWRGLQAALPRRRTS